MKIAYFDCFAGASGDMILGALIDAGLDIEQLKTELAKLHLDNYDIQVKNVIKKGIGGTKASVTVDEHDHHHRHLSHIREIIEKSGLDESVKQKSIQIFTRLAQAEAKVHRTSAENIHFHEVGAVDAIIDVVGGVAGIAALGIEKVFCSSLHVGTGTVECAHGILPVPAPATAELVKGKPVYSSGIRGELLTPTGAAILTALSSDFGPMPAMTIEKTGYGAGTSELDIPNLLRVSVGEANDSLQDYETDQVAVIETNIDDMNPQIYDYIIQKALDMGALDIFLVPAQMKKNRPGTLVTVICQPDMAGKFSDFLIRETSTIGLRQRKENRIKARRKIKNISTKYGTISFKMAEVGNTVVNAVPEYEDCKRAATDNNIPLKTVMEEVRGCLQNKDSWTD
ncbi:MAG: nickel pincer cofactor biosynthesis protein LarC [Desulfobacteraceae bacterium]|nr:nickel pincer cofactor biosynthesis protein LarC [Desulfobacteraceae bacterium]